MKLDSTGVGNIFLPSRFILQIPISSADILSFPPTASHTYLHRRHLTGVRVFVDVWMFNTASDI
ncbi:CIC11C00000002173 [Sungouiella intermedia]|uniref:CIC11C00000002173 n=1 Tax=Sungouiella intermedia TaxID=45354 RepID=A0A1L0C5K4_9ASCO|nr:CIC11C00000002173 [[Candida] intermedia]